MIISDLNYLENTSEEVLGGFSFVATKNVAIVIKVNETIVINKNVTSNVKLVGSVATAEGQATASGNNTLAEVFSFTDTTPKSSSSNSLAISASSK
ncbi:hypothetical protein [Nostoc sp. WHI]|uniref:hypothetical protein n=1 Tax=Nostoc sp. WHI TaxID=2650611 RepID=UPI0018C55A51|nr:hypothetical protein [Nostoc sp. WHI]MBG1265062.1 hypothetical protein [Nostoc sp. WHI]